MTYLVMECHSAYAVVLDEEGRFLKTANLNYEIGQRVSVVYELQEHTGLQVTSGKVFRAASLAACVCVVLFAFWQLLFLPYGTVRMQINPDVSITSNRMGYALALEGQNADGVKLLEGYPYQHKKLERIFDELADRAAEMGYLKENGTIYISVISENQSWQEKTQAHVVQSLRAHVGDAITVVNEKKAEEAETKEQVQDATERETGAEAGRETDGKIAGETQKQEPQKNGEAGRRAEAGEDEDEDEDDDNEDDDEDTGGEEKENGVEEADSPEDDEGEDTGGKEKEDGAEEAERFDDEDGEDAEGMEEAEDIEEDVQAGEAENEEAAEPEEGENHGGAAGENAPENGGEEAPEAEGEIEE